MRRLTFSRRASGHARLFDDPELGVLWLTKGSHELAVSDGGVWLRRGRQQADLLWSEVDQVQVQPIRQGTEMAWVEVFAGRRSFRLGPYPAPSVRRWVQACVVAAEKGGERPEPLEGAEGFAVRQMDG